MTTVALGYGIVCAAIVAFVARLELRQRRLRRQYATLSQAVAAHDDTAGDAPVSRAA